MINVAIFASGTGTNALKLLSHARELDNISVPCLIIDTVTSPLPQMMKADFPEIKTYQILPDTELRGEARRTEHEGRIIQVLEENKIEWICLAGYMRLIGPRLLTQMKSRKHAQILNIHPSLLPLYPGKDAYERAFIDGVTKSGVTVHLVDEGMDSGPVVLQESFPRKESDSLVEFIRRGKELEWKLYPKVLSMISKGVLDVT